MSVSVPSISNAIGIAYRDLVSVARALPRLMLVALVVMSAANLVLSLAEVDSAKSHAYTLLWFLDATAQNFLLTPFYIAVHRFIVLGETNAHYALTPREPRFQRYFVLSTAVTAVLAAPSFLADAAAPEVTVVPVTLTIVAFAIAVVWLMILFPAIAVDAPGATIGNALADTKAHAWRLLAVSVVALLPPSLLSLVVAGLYEPGMSAARLLADTGSGILDTVFETLFLVIASRFYLWIGERLNRPE